VSLYLAEKLDLKLGDEVTSQIADQRLSAKIQSIRKVDWKTLRPNFYFIFPPSMLDTYPHTWLLGKWLSTEQASHLTETLRQYPSITIISISEVLKQIQQLVSGVSNLIQLMLGLMASTGFIILFLLVSSAREQRLNQFILLRSLGASRRLILNSQHVEFAFMGMMAGLIAAAISEGLTQYLQVSWLNGVASFHPSIWIGLPLIAISFNLLIGYQQIKATLKLPVMKLLKS
jgi:putative ABC transport system permease protein